MTIQTDALVIGSGPVGLFQVFELGLLGIRAHVIEAMPDVGGQCAELYPDKPIYDIPGLLVCTGHELVERLRSQIAPFHAQFHTGQEVVQVAADGNDRHLVTTSGGLQFSAACVFIAAGVGAFRPRKLAVDGLARYEGTQLWHHGASPQGFAGQRLVVVGGGDLALDAVMAAASITDPAARPASITLLHRRDHFQAEATSIARLSELRAQGAVQFITGQVTAIEGIEGGPLTVLQVTAPDETTQRLPVDHVWVRLGLVPQLGPLAQWGVAMDRRQVVVDTEKFETTVPGIYAVGDVNFYPGKRRLIVCGFHEATLAAFAAAARLHPGERIALEYTTSSTRLQERLGVAPLPPSTEHS